MSAVHYLGCPENSIILTLEHALEKARAGEVNSLYIASTLKSGDVMSCAVLSDDAPLYTLIGIVEAAKSELIAKHGEPLPQDIDYTG